MSTDHELLAPFFEDWAKEFARSVEMFAGEKAAVTSAPAGPADFADAADYSWWKQSFEGRGAFVVWSGAPEESWRALGGAMAAAPEQAQEAFLEMLGQAQQGAAAVSSAGLPQPLRCAEAEQSPPPPLESLTAHRIGIEFRGTALPPLLLAIEPDAAAVLGLGPESQKPAAAGSKAVARTAESESGSEMLDRLLEVNLPLSVALGRTTMPVRDILKMTPGALVELDRDIGEFVEIVVNGTVVARGEVVSVKGNYGVRIKEIISREDRLALRYQG